MAYKNKAFDSQRSSKVSFLPEKEFVMNIIGSIASGKSTLLLNLLSNTEFFYGKFNKIYFCSPTCLLDEKIQKTLCGKDANGLIVPNIPLVNEIIKRRKQLQEGRGNEIGTSPITNDARYLELLQNTTPRSMEHTDFITETNLAFIPEINKNQSEIIQEFGKDLADRVLIILDDIVGCRSALRSETLLQSIVQTRHHKCSTIILSQCYFEIPKSIRLNSGVKAIFYVTNKKELTSIYDENSCELSNAEFMDAYHKIHTEMYKTCVINHFNPRGYKLIDNFEKYVEKETSAASGNTEPIVKESVIKNAEKKFLYNIKMEPKKLKIKYILSK